MFEDRNGDGARDANERPVPDMPVSDGVTIRRTGTDGAFEFKLDEAVSGAVFVCTPAGWRASKWFYVIADFDRHAGQTQTGDIGLVRDAAREAERFSFVQVSDTHVTDAANTVETMIDDLNVINRISDSPTFVVATGDLVNRGTRPEELEGYVRATQAARRPYYNVVGNHDYGGTQRQTENYERYLGPRYYSFDVGRYHFIAKDIIAHERKDPPAYERQEKWIEEDIRTNAGNRRIIVFQHYLPRNIELDWWSRFNTAAVFSGHWHGRRERSYKGILDVNSAPLRFGGIDRSPRGFRIIHVDGDKLTCEWRVGQQERRLEIVHPADGAEVDGHQVHLQALAYDTAIRVDKVHYRLEIDDGAGTGPQRVVEGDLAPAGRWMWADNAQIAPGGEAVRGAGRLTVEALAADGSRWTAESKFNVTGRNVVAPKMGEPWRFFHGDIGHRGYVRAGPKPPLSMAWATNVGGTILLASPVIADGRVYVGTGFGESLDDCAVHALDFACGRILWRSPVDSSVQHSLAAWGSNVLAVSQAASLYCFDPDGSRKWVASLARDRDTRWELSFPITDGRVVYAGRCDGFGAYNLEDGKPIWQRPGGNDWWPSIYSGPSLGTRLVYQGGPFARALDPASGDVVWSRADTVISTVAVVPAVVEAGEQGDRLYVFRNEKTLMCLDGRSGETIWTAHREPSAAVASAPAADAPLGNETGTPAVGEHVVCIGGGQVNWPGEPQGSAAMHGFDKQTGRLLWRHAVDRGVVSSIPYQRGEATITSSPVIVGDVVYFGANDGWLRALDLNTGEPLWQYRLGVPIASTIAVTGNTIVVAAWDGTVYAFTGQTGTAK
ncbi:MAG: PQQ-binding-like beta-propeller repeat protein [Planctomycetes bacterium]|nr:PQQ-binding-like beta-propeller repeat protein [Planctomycetota bacterium]